MVLEENRNVLSKEGKEKHEDNIMMDKKISKWVGGKSQKPTVLVFTAGRERPALDWPRFSLLASLRRV